MLKPDLNLLAIETIGHDQGAAVFFPHCFHRLCTCIAFVRNNKVQISAEGLNAGMWTIGLAISGNEVGLPPKEWKALPAEEQATKRERAYRRMEQCGAHYIVDSIADIQARIHRDGGP